MKNEQARKRIAEIVTRMAGNLVEMKALADELKHDYGIGVCDVGILLSNNIHLFRGIERVEESLKKPLKTVQYAGRQKAYIQIAGAEILQMSVPSKCMFQTAESALKWEEDER